MRSYLIFIPNVCRRLWTNFLVHKVNKVPITGQILRPNFAIFCLYSTLSPICDKTWQNNTKVLQTCVRVILGSKITHVWLKVILTESRLKSRNSYNVNVRLIFFYFHLFWWSCMMSVSAILSEIWNA